jgi:1-acyl-sn-glycerol-3-phosphate acyltransferase
MAVFRSLLFLLILLVVTPPYTLGVILCRPLPHHMRRQTVVPWVNFTIWLIKHVLGIPYRLVGTENIPARPAGVLCKHQSAWETFMLQEVFKDTVFVWRKEIKYLPFFGWALASIPMIETDRNASRSSLKRLVDQGRDRLDKGYTVIIFPEGTARDPVRRTATRSAARTWRSKPAHRWFPWRSIRVSSGAATRCSRSAAPSPSASARPSIRPDSRRTK